jgi:methionine-gamma-lyase
MTGEVMNTKELGFATKLVHAGFDGDPSGCVNVPIYQSSTFAFRDAKQGAARFSGEEDGYIYTRIGNPTIRVLEKNVAELEKGYDGIATSSGLGAISTVFMAFLSQGKHIVSTSSVYGPSRGVIEKHLSRFGVTGSFVDTSDINKVGNSIRPETEIIYIETPANPSMIVTDLSAVSEIAKANNCILIVDNTFASPYLQKPLDLGADVVLHSMTKFINGHADIVGGMIVSKTKEMYQKIRPLMVDMGWNMDPHQAFLVLRGLKTLAIRIERAQESAMQIAQWLEAHPKVSWVRYLGLPSHPQYALAQQQMSGFGSMISFELRGGIDAGRQLMDRVKVATLAVSLGGVETLIEHPSSMTHAGMSQEDRFDAGITDGLVRYSVGIENVEDLLNDLEIALNSL